jgi:pimeloyl-ACP methyl ester carboxylesterase
VHVVGFSFGGDEATILASDHPSRVLSLTLLESYDNSPAANTFASMDKVSPPPPRPFLAADSANIVAFIARNRRAGFRPFPLSETCATERFTTAGRYLGPVTPDSIDDLVIQGSSSRSVEDLYARYATLDSLGQAAAVGYWRADSQASASARHRLGRALPRARIVEVPGGEHPIMRSNPEIVFLELRRFLASQHLPRQ